MKVCTKCSQPGEFYKDKNHKDGHRTICKVCDRKKATMWNKLNKIKHCESQKLWRETNRQASRDQRYEYVDRHRYKINALSAKRRAAKLNATLPRFDEEIKEIYKNCPDGHHVDHVIPLQGKTVCGLHVPWNLQYLTAEENLSKGNRIIND